MYMSTISKTRISSLFRCLSTTSSNVQIINHKIKSLIDNHNSVIISHSHDIFENLALEDWLYKNYDLSSKDVSILLMWFNGPTVVIGRHQNPWIECSVDFCEANGINIARRNSGGGTVYHDFGNLNFSFLTPRKTYNRKRNLELICESVHRRWPVNLNVIQRDDILYNNEYKVSGTASKLGRNYAYHHCTLLINVDEVMLKQALHRDLKGVESKATSSTRAKVTNLNSICSDIDTVSVMKAVKEYYKELNKIADENVLCVHPSEDMFPGINSIEENFKSWEWRFGRTPRFSIARSFQISDHETKHSVPSVEITMNINKGRIECISLSPQILKNESYNALNQCIVNSPLSLTVGDSFDKWMHNCDDKLLCQIVKCNLLQMISEVFR